MKQKSSKANRSRFLGIVCMTVVVLFGLSSCRPDYDLDTTMPANLGSSIYKFLQEEGFDTYVKLIDDLGYKDVLAKTGSKTLFVADEAAVQRFYKSGVFTKADGSPVTCYEDLSLAQKKMILYGSMIDNVYQAASLSTAEGPTLGKTMRRKTSSSIYDTLPVLTPADMPVAKSPEAGTDYWKSYRREGHNVMTFAGDMSEKPMIVFTPKFMQLNKMNSDDFDFLFNLGGDDGKPGSKPNDVSVNGVRIISQNNRCFNGFVHVMEDVIYSLPNMSDYLRSSDDATVYNALLQRFSTLQYVGEDVMRDLRSLFDDQSLDSVFEYRFFAENARTVQENGFTENADRVKYKEESPLVFDPSWNAYNNASGSEDAALAMERDMAVMLVPTDSAMLNWWNYGEGKILKETFGISSGNIATSEALIADMENLPDRVVVELIRNNQKSSLVNSVPSMFSVVMDDASDPMGIKTDHVDRVAMCCNGAIYFTNRVFSPAAYRAVSYPALILENFEVIRWAIENLYFKDYLKSMQAEYSFFIPVIMDSQNPELNGKLAQINPMSFNNSQNKELGMCEIAVFSYDYQLAGDQSKIPVVADLYEYNYITRQIGARVKQKITDTEIKSILSFLLDYHIVIGLVDETDYQYYQTKGRGTVMIGRENGTVKEIYGGFELDNENPIASQVLLTYNMKESGNGVAYIIDGPIHPSKRSVYEVLTDDVNYPEFSEFAKLMRAASYGGKSVFEVDYDGKPIGSPYNVSQFNTYHYTVYVPKNESIRQAVEDGLVISLDSLENFENKCIDMMVNASDAEYENYMKQLSLEAKGVEDPGYTYLDHLDFLTGKIMDFVKYHIQDNSVFIGGEFSLSDEDIATNKIDKKFETAYFKKDNTFATLTVNPNSNGEYTIVDEAGNIAKVVNEPSETGKSLNNIMCCEYVYTDEELKELYTSSYAVIHQIDKPLIAK